MALAVLWETAAQRQRIHRARWDIGRACDAKVVIAGVNLVEVGRLRTIAATGKPLVGCRDCGGQPAPAQSAGQRFYVGGECPCRTLLVEVFLTAHQYLVEQAGAVRHPEGAARRHLASRQHDYPRLRRGEMGAQVRTDRLLTSARARQLGTDEQRLLLRDLADEAGSEAPLEGNDQLELRLAQLRARRTGAEPVRLLPEIRRDLAAVKAVYSTGRLVNVGTAAEPELVSWWEAYIERPLGRRMRTSDIPATTAPNSADLTPGLELPCPVGEAAYQQVLDRMSAAADQHLLGALIEQLAGDDGADRSRQLERALRGLAADGKVLGTVVDAFLTDPGRRSAALAALDELLPTGAR